METLRHPVAWLTLGPELGTVRVVNIDHRCQQPRPVKQLSLGLPIGFHAAVIVQMVLREIGEQGHTDMATVQTVLDNANR